MNFDVATNNRFTAPVAGFYRFDAMSSLTNGANAAYVISLYKNGAILMSGIRAINNATVQSVGSTLNTKIQLAATDYIEIFGNTSFGAGANLDVGTAPLNNYFSGCLVSV